MDERAGHVGADRAAIVSGPAVLLLQACDGTGVDRAVVAARAVGAGVGDGEVVVPGRVIRAGSRPLVVAGLGLCRRDAAVVARRVVRTGCHALVVAGFGLHGDAMVVGRRIVRSGRANDAAVVVTGFGMRPGGAGRCSRRCSHSSSSRIPCDPAPKCPRACTASSGSPERGHGACEEDGSSWRVFPAGPALLRRNIFRDRWNKSARAKCRSGVGLPAWRLGAGSSRHSAWIRGSHVVFLAHRAASETSWAEGEAGEEIWSSTRVSWRPRPASSSRSHPQASARAKPRSRRATCRRSGAVIKDFSIG